MHSRTRQRCTVCLVRLDCMVTSWITLRHWCSASKDLLSKGPHGVNNKRQLSSMVKQAMSGKWVVVMAHPEWPHKVHSDASTVSVGGVTTAITSQVTLHSLHYHSACQTTTQTHHWSDGVHGHCLGTTQNEMLLCVVHTSPSSMTIINTFIVMFKVILVFVHILHQWLFTFHNQWLFSFSLNSKLCFVGFFKWTYWLMSYTQSLYGELKGYMHNDLKTEYVKWGLKKEKDCWF